MLAKCLEDVSQWNKGLWYVLDRKTNKESDKESKINVMCITFLFLLFTFDKGSLYSLGYHGTLYAGLARLKSNFCLPLPPSTRELKVSATTPSFSLLLSLIWVEWLFYSFIRQKTKLFSFVLNVLIVDKIANIQQRLLFGKHCNYF